VLPDWTIRKDLASGKLARVLPKWNADEFLMNVVYPSHRMLPARVRAFIDFAFNLMTVELRTERRGSRERLKALRIKNSRQRKTESAGKKLCLRIVASRLSALSAKTSARV
jgi:hypothetical protein